MQLYNISTKKKGHKIYFMKTYPTEHEHEQEWPTFPTSDIYIFTRSKDVIQNAWSHNFC